MCDRTPPCQTCAELDRHCESLPSYYDGAHVGDLVAGRGDWFSAHLYRLMAKADEDNYARLKVAFPEHAAQFEAWQKGSP